jgi:exodeoxyribonuclease VII small subunit
MATTFTQKLQRLEAIVAQLERPEVELEDGLTLLEEGVLLHQECQQLLTQTQAKITKLLDAQPAVAAKAERPPKEIVEVAETTLFEASGTDDPIDKEDGLPF